jgi:hypothetical protein
MDKKNLLALIFSVLVFSLAIPLTNYSQQKKDNRSIEPTNSKPEANVGQVINKYLSAIGGMDRVKKLTSKTIKYKVFMVKRGGYAMEQVVKRPGYLKIGRPGASRYTLLEDNRAWRVNGDQKQEVKGGVVNQFKRKADMDGPFIESSSKGIGIKYLGKERFEFSQLHHLEVSFKDGTKKHYYFEHDSGLLTIVKEPSFLLINNKISEGPTSIYYYYDYREVDGLKFPFLWVQTDKNLEHMHVFIVEKIELDFHHH